MTTVYRYTELLPRELAERLATVPAAIAPWGALEWHGPHLPLGLDGLVAEAFCERLAAATGALLLPATYLPITALPHPHSISTPASTVIDVWGSLFEALGKVGVRLVCLVSGHYAQGHELTLLEIAEKAARSSGPLVLAGTPLSVLGDPHLLDHAGRWETSQLLTVRPDLVHLERLPKGALPGVHEVPVLGEDPRLASAEQGEAVFAQALESWGGWVKRLLEDPDPAPLLDHYAERRGWYDEYVRRYYRGSWEEAIEAWWRERGG